MLTKIEEIDLEKICYLFNYIRFYLGRSVLQGLMGEAYVNDTKNPTFAILREKDIQLRKILNLMLNNYKDM